MAYPDLRSFIAELTRRGELLRVTEPVSHELEITEIADRMVKRGGPALLFENIPGKDFPLVIGLYGTRERMALALGTPSLDAIADRIRGLLDVKVGGGLIGLASNLPKLKELAALPPKRVRGGPVQEVVWRGDQVDLNPPADHQMLAAGRRAVYYFAAGDYQRPRDRRGQHRHVPHAGV